MAHFGNDMPNSRRLHEAIAATAWGKDLDGITTIGETGEICICFTTPLANQRNLDTLVAGHDKTPDPRPKTLHEELVELKARLEALEGKRVA